MKKTLLVVTLAAVLASAAGAAPAPITLSATPTIVTLLGASRGSIHVTNPSGRAITIDVSLGNYDITSTGHVVIDPKEPPNRAAEAWLTASPHVLRLAPNAGADVAVTSHPPKNAEPGDHHALVLLTARTQETGQVGVRTRIGVGVLVRMPGDIVRRVAVESLGVEPATRTIHVRLANRGNVNERLAPGQITLALQRSGRTITVLRTRPVDLLAASSQTIDVAYGRNVSGAATIVVHVRPTAARVDGPGMTVTAEEAVRTFRVRL